MWIETALADAPAMPGTASVLRGLPPKVVARARRQMGVPVYLAPALVILRRPRET